MPGNRVQPAKAGVPMTASIALQPSTPDLGGLEGCGVPGRSFQIHVSGLLRSKREGTLVISRGLGRGQWALASMPFAGIPNNH